MCTGVRWVIRCCRCWTIIMKNSNIAGYTCHKAQMNRKKGCCRTGVEFTSYDRIGDELCVPCELEIEIQVLDADTCDEGHSEERVGYDVDDCYDSEDEEEGGALLVWGDD
ncbi:uncharacterized protein F4822DRAFT_424455 [Hypoxylon trugodes]|uniref:uncharacterized protein n=1 Tax=Hypoxylon trugodes TaxID=326681 RepID=UPI00219EB879|nr:uncharacterized protein F4822DRAFT_424455 [Hypoxylon trugodes]KAI1393998.1 hypothetical protein F4822DRAFT_424455 [Hypoxylon trugodes]